MQNSINKILSKKTSYTADFTYADTSILYNELATGQITVNDQLNKILKVADHLARFNGSTIEIIDMITGAEEIALNTHQIEKISSTLDTQIISTMVANFTYKEFFDGGIDGTPSLIDKQSSLTEDTGYLGGASRTVDSNIQATGGTTEIDYDTTNLEYILTRKKTLNEKKPITIVMDDFYGYNIGSKLTFDTDFETGYVVVKDIKPTDGAKKTIAFVGLGEYTRKP